MDFSADIKKIVRTQYGNLLSDKMKISGCCSLPTDTCTDNSKVVDYAMFKDSYDSLNGYVPEADFGLGCGIPTKFVSIRKGDRVLDLGSGAGNDVFIARSIVGETGFVIGLDMTKEMIDRANYNKVKLGYDNVKFVLGDIEDMPVISSNIDVVISNCVLNLVVDKPKAFGEMYRVIKPSGRFSISDIVLNGDLPSKILASANMYAGCISGALQKEKYIEIIKDAGFKDVEIKASKPITIPDNYLEDCLSKEEIKKYKSLDTSIESITVVGIKP